MWLDCGDRQRRLSRSARVVWKKKREKEEKIKVSTTRGRCRWETYPFVAYVASSTWVKTQLPDVAAYTQTIFSVSKAREQAYDVFTLLLSPPSLYTSFILFLFIFFFSFRRRSLATRMHPFSSTCLASRSVTGTSNWKRMNERTNETKIKCKWKFIAPGDRRRFRTFKYFINFLLLLLGEPTLRALIRHWWWCFVACSGAMLYRSMRAWFPGAAMVDRRPRRREREAEEYKKK